MNENLAEDYSSDENIDAVGVLNKFAEEMSKLSSNIYNMRTDKNYRTEIVVADVEKKLFKIFSNMSDTGLLRKF